MRDIGWLPVPNAAFCERSVEGKWHEVGCLRLALANVRAQLAAEKEARLKAEGAKNGAYSERNQCVALIVRMALALGWRAGVGKHEDKPGEAWEPDWRTLVSIDLPTGQASWHFHDSEKHLLAGLPKYAAPWDGHDTPEKYRRLRAALASSPPSENFQPASEQDSQIISADAQVEGVRSAGRPSSLRGTTTGLPPPPQATPPPEQQDEALRAGALDWLRVVADAFGRLHCDYCDALFVTQDGLNEDCVPLHYAIGGVVRFLGRVRAPPPEQGQEALREALAHIHTPDCTLGSDGGCQHTARIVARVERSEMDLLARRHVVEMRCAAAERDTEVQRLTAALRAHGCTLDVDCVVCWAANEPRPFLSAIAAGLRKKAAAEDRHESGATASPPPASLMGCPVVVDQSMREGEWKLVPPPASDNPAAHPALGRCNSHLGAPGSTREPHPEGATCHGWKADPAPAPKEK